METINVNGISFRWNGDQLLITTRHGQDLLSGSDAGLLLDFVAVPSTGDLRGRARPTITQLGTIWTTLCSQRGGGRGTPTT